MNPNVVNLEPSHAKVVLVLIVVVEVGEVVLGAKLFTSNAVSKSKGDV